MHINISTYQAIANNQACTQFLFQVLYILGFKTFKKTKLNQLKVVDIQDYEIGYW